MNKEEANEVLIKLWLEKASDALASARLELDEGHLSFAVNRLYYSCFYAVTALLLKSGKQFARHSAVISEFNRNYVKTGKVNVAWSKFYQKLFDDRQESDYTPILRGCWSTRVSITTRRRTACFLESSVSLSRTRPVSIRWLEALSGPQHNA